MNIGPCWHHSFSQRSSGVLLHVTSLPGLHGSGDLGAEALQFIEFLEQAGQSWWQMLPVNPPGRAPAFSPYDAASAFAGSPWLVSLDRLAAEGLLTPGEAAPPSRPSTRRVDFAATQLHREEGLRRAFAAFRRRRGERTQAYQEFRDTHRDWLEDYALFAALRRASGGQPWTAWEPDVRGCRPSDLRAANERLREEVAAQRFVQYAFDRQWRALRLHAQRHGIGLIGDVPIFVAHDSADVWRHQELFQLDAAGLPRQLSGYPPDRFNRRGQHWGHPQYRWEAHTAADFAWWVRRFARLFELFDAVRIDHFLGFTRTWSIPAEAPDATRGRWVPSPGWRLLAAVRRRLGPRPMIAEDLGHVTEADRRLRDAFELAPMRLFQFGFGKDPDSTDHLPHNYPALCAAYPGTHDNDTTRGWFGHLTASERRRVLAYTGGSSSTIHLDSRRALLASSAALVICPVQDLLGLDSEARMNVPGTVSGNWGWRLNRLPSQALARRIRLQTELFQRNPRPPLPNH